MGGHTVSQTNLLWKSSIAFAYLHTHTPSQRYHYYLLITRAAVCATALEVTQNKKQCKHMRAIICSSPNPMQCCRCASGRAGLLIARVSF